MFLRPLCFYTAIFHIMANKNFLIAGLGNIGPEYEGTRHNIGFMIADALAKSAGATFEDKRYGFVATVPLRGNKLYLLKPSTYMNLSGNAVRYWLQQNKIAVENLLVAVDDLSLPFGKIRLKPSGSEAGHNGLKNITSVLGTQNYARLRFGIGNNYPRGGQVDWVLGKFPPEQLAEMDARLNVACEAIKAFCLTGIDFAMTNFNNK